LGTIFINETDYHNRKIEPIIHPWINTHQKTFHRHITDWNFKSTVWFNLIFIFYKSNPTQSWILADEKVVKSHNDVPFYQNLLISKANANSTYYLASNLNYSVTKKRLIMMTKPHPHQEHY
jgi:hypothetical protein